MDFFTFSSYYLVIISLQLMRSTDISLGRDPFNQNFRKFWSKTQWIGSVQPEKFRKNWSTFWGGPLFPVGPVWILVEWIAPLIPSLFRPFNRSANSKQSHDPQYVNCQYRGAHATHGGNWCNRPRLVSRAFAITNRKTSCSQSRAR